MASDPNPFRSGCCTLIVIVCVGALLAVIVAAALASAHSH